MCGRPNRCLVDVDQHQGGETGGKCLLRISGDTGVVDETICRIGVSNDRIGTAEGAKVAPIVLVYLKGERSRKYDLEYILDALGLLTEMSVQNTHRERKKGRAARRMIIFNDSFEYISGVGVICFEIAQNLRVLGHLFFDEVDGDDHIWEIRAQEIDLTK